MAIHRLIALSNPTEGQEDDYNDWYTNRHLAEVVEIPGFTAAQRFRLSEAQLAGFPPSAHRYLAIYEFSTDPGKPLEELHERVESGHIALPPSIKVDEIRVWAFTSISDRVTATETPARAQA